MRFFKLFILLFLVIRVFAQEEMALKNRFEYSEPGDFIVLEQSKIYTLLHIYDKFDNTVVLEEISVPASKVSKKSFSWKDWFESGAPGNTSWTMSQINLDQGEILDSYSFTRQGWLNVAYTNSFLSTLLNLRFKEIPSAERKRVGPQPGYGKADNRPIWNPRLIIGNEVLTGVSFSAWRTRWPNDGTELARKRIEIYLPEPDQNYPNAYPTYFPYWIDIEGKLGSAQVRVVDSGLDAISPQPPIYRTGN